MHLENLKSSVGKKAVMAVTGLLLLGFVLGHLGGNLTIFGGPDVFNAYAKKLQSLGPLLWLARSGLLVILALHIVSAIQIARENKCARPIKYRKQQTEETSYAARTMMMSGIIVFAFIVYHLLHFTFCITHPEFSGLYDHRGYHHVYALVVQSFQLWPVAAGYILAVFLLSNHLSHGLSSACQSLGFINKGSESSARLIGRLLAGLIFIGYASIPAACLMGILTYTGGSAS